MSSNIFVNTYQRYKKQTDRIAQWLVDTAEQCGYSSLIPSSEESKEKGTCGKKGDNSQCPPYRIRRNQFVELAGFIVDSKRAPSIPGTLINLLKDTINLRRSFSQFFKRHSRADSTVDADIKHSHFIRNLEEVLEVLLPRRAQESSDQVANTSSNQNVSNPMEPRNLNIENRFSSLELNEPDEADLFPDVPSSSTSKKSATSQRRVCYEADRMDEDESDEIYFAIYWFFEDLHNTRIHLQRLWTQYKLGMVTLEDASVITNTAIDLARRADQELCLLLPTNIPEIAKMADESAKLGNFMYLYICLTNGVDHEKKLHPDDWFNYEMVDLAQWLYMPSQILLKSFCDVLNPRQLPIFKKGYFGTYKPEANRSKMSLQEKFAENKIILLEALPDFCMLEEAKAEPLGQDELTKGLRDMCKTKKTSAWLCFATQVFLDINHLLRLQVHRGLQELKVDGGVVKKSLKKTVEFTANTKLDNWATSNNRLISHTISIIDEWILGDIISKSKVRLLGAKKFEFGGQPEPYHLLKRHPLLCGMMKFSLTLMVREIGTTVVEAWGSILYSAHLYNALRQTSSLDTPWPEMETFISIHTPEKLFVGGYPTTVEDCLKRYYLMMGVAPQSFAKDRIRNHRARNNFHAINGPRRWNVDPPIVEIFKKRFVEMRGSEEWSIHNIERLLNETNQTKPQQRAARRRWEKSQQLSTLQLLYALQDALLAEAKGLHFDYLGMHFQCIEVLHALRTELHEKFVQYFGPRYLDHDGQITNIVGYILTVAENSQQIGQAMKLKSTEMGSALLARSSGVFKSFIDPSRL